MSFSRFISSIHIFLFKTLCIPLNKVITHLGEFFSDYLSDIFIIFFMNIKYHWDSIVGKNLCSSFCFRDLVTAGRELICTGTVVSIVMYSIQTAVKVIARSSHTGKSPPFKTRNYQNGVCHKGT